MKRKLKGVFAAAFAVCMAVMLAGCGPTIEYLYESDNLATAHSFYLELTKTELDSLNGAGNIRAGTTRWSVSAYVEKLAEVSGCAFQESATDSPYAVRLDKLDADADDSQYFTREKPKPEDEKWGFFVHEYKVTQKNPFYAVYDGLAGGESPSGGFVDIILNGSGTLPPIRECFAFPDGFDFGDTKVTFYFRARAGMQGDGAASETGGFTRYLKWTGTLRAFNNAEITYTFYRPNTLGWNVLALLIAAAVAAIIILATKNSKKLPRLVKIEPRRRPVPHLNVRDIDVFGLNAPPGGQVPPPFDAFGNPLPPQNGQGYPPPPYGNPYYPPYGYPLSPEQQRERAKRELDDIFAQGRPPQTPPPDEKQPDNDENK
ncbi:MAG: hypothetical protein LBH24_05990 [Clostridiales bacterium]|jgi:hypothetical protein|nr:hypothetical protein [Clostridiales bacterium]